MRFLNILLTFIIFFITLTSFYIHPVSYNGEMVEEKGTNCTVCFLASWSASSIMSVRDYLYENKCDSVIFVSLDKYKCLMEETIRLEKMKCDTILYYYDGVFNQYKVDTTLKTNIIYEIENGFIENIIENTY